MVHPSAVKQFTSADGSHFPFGETWVQEDSHGYHTPYKFTGKEYDERTGLYYYGARYYDPRTSVWQSPDPILNEYMSGQTNGGVFNPRNLSLFTYTYNNPVNMTDPDGNAANLVAGGIGALIGGVIGGGIEIGTQLWNDGSVSNWKAVGGSALQGAAVGGTAGLTAGASLTVTAGSAGVANAAGGAANRGIQGESTTVGDVVTDATVGAVFGAGGKYVGDKVGNSLNNLSNSSKGKLGESLTTMKYNAMGYKDTGKVKVLTGTKTPTGRDAFANFDHGMKNVFTGNTKTVESKFNTSRFTKNQSIVNQAQPGTVNVQRWTGDGIGNTVDTIIRSSGSVGVQ